MFHNRRNIIVLLYCVSTAALLFGGYLFAVQTWRNQLQAVDKDLFKAIVALKNRIPEEYFDRAVTPDAVSQKEYAANSHILDSINYRYDIAWLYSMVEVEGKFYHTNSNGTASEEQRVPYFTEYTDDWKSLRLTSRDGKTRYDSEIDSYGEMRSCVRRFTTAKGQHYLVGADIPLEKVRFLSWSYLETFLPCTAGQQIFTAITISILIILSVGTIK
ncbi:MAG: hypothetical protein LBT89_09685, partial [Planctomycetaceae bacterium]|nr:hypothetical protein [Planctomycetaceae bacterium]